MKAIICGTLLVAMLAGCASYQPVVDSRGVNPARYDNDLATCQGYASRENPTNGALAGGAVGAAGGAIVGALIGGGTGAAWGAGVGGATGATIVGTNKQESQADIIRNCMREHGYRVLN